MKPTRFFAIALVFTLANVAAPAQAEDKNLALGLEGVRFLYSLIPSGADISLTYNGIDLLDAADTKLYLKAGGGYQDTVLLRDPDTGDPVLYCEDEGTGVGFNKTNFQWELAFIQGLSRRSDGANETELFAFYRGRYDYYPTQDEPDTVFTDIHGLLGTSVMGGVSYDSTVQSRHRSKQGVYAEATAEWAPGFVNQTADFWRVSAQARGFLPVFDVPTDGGNLFNIYLAGFSGVDYAAGASVPIYVNQSFGGRDLRGSLGDTVRGYGWNAYDAALKAVANAEVRLVGPAIVIEGIVPYLFGFADGGYYAGFSDSATKADSAGILASSGGGIAVDLVGFAQISVIAGFKLVDDQLYGDLDPFFWGLKFFLHF